MFKGITVVLYEKTQTGVDEFNKPVYEEIAVDVPNVLVEPLNADDLVNTNSLYGKTASYRLCIPKGDTHKWEDSKIEFFDIKWQSFGFVTELIEENVPLKWNKKVLVERYG